MRRRAAYPLRAAVVALVAAAAPGAAGAATLAELARWCAPGDDRLCGAYLETILTGLSSTDPVMNGGNRMCIPADANRDEIVGLVRAYAAKASAPDRMAALDGVGAALKGRYPCR